MLARGEQSSTLANQSFFNINQEKTMFTFKRDGNVFFLTEWRLCCMCCRMFPLNTTSYVIGYNGHQRLWQHVVCPEPKPERRLLK